MPRIALIFFLSLILRLVKIQDFLFFGFEQGRDLQIVQKIYQLRDFVLVGPSTSIGGVFHGPWYYYLLSLPLGLSSGNPLAASIFLIVLGSFVPVVIYLLAKDIFNSKFWGVVAGIFTVFSYEYILYARWLSNVSPAPLFASLAFLMIWKYSKMNREKFFLLFVFFSGIAVLFQMILIVQFGFVFLILLLFKVIKPPPLKNILFSAGILLILFGPLILFDFRNQHLIFSSLLNFNPIKDSQNTNPFGGLLVYLEQMRNHLQLSLVNLSFFPLQIAIMISIFAGVYLSYRKKSRKQIIFLIGWILMGLPLILISPGNPQYYVCIGLGWILLFTLTLKTFWEAKKLKIAAILLAGVFFLGIISTVSNLLNNKEVFFRTIQDDLNYADQKKVLDFIHNDSSGAPYRFISFTIPSLQPQGWDYLKSYFYPNDPERDAKIVYVVIEKNVYPVWENKWIDDLGKSELLFEKNFGLLRLQKRKIID